MMSSDATFGDIVFSCVPSEGSNVCVQARSLESGALVKTYKGSSSDDRVGTISLAGRSYLLGAMLVKPFIIVWALQKEQAHMRIACSGKVETLACTSDGMYCAAAIKQTIYIWQIATGHLMASASRHYQNITVLRFVDDGSHLVSGGYDNLVIVWRVARLFSASLESGGCESHFITDGYPGHSSSSSQLTRHVWDHHSQPLSDIYCGKGGVNCRVVTSSLDRTCKMYELLSGRLLFSLLLDHPLMAVTMNLSESWLFVGAQNGSITQLNLFLPEVYRNSTEVNRELNKKSFKGHVKSVTGLQISSSGQVLVSSSADGCVIQWDIHSKQSTKMQINKMAVRDFILKHLPDSLYKSGPWKPEMLPPLKPFLKQPLFSNFLTVDLLGDVGKELVVTEKKGGRTRNAINHKASLQNGDMRKETKSDSKLNNGVVDSVDRGTVPKEELESLQEELAKMREVHRRLLHFTEESLLCSQPPSKIRKLTD